MKIGDGNCGVGALLDNGGISRSQQFLHEGKEFAGPGLDTNQVGESFLAEIVVVSGYGPFPVFRIQGGKEYVELSTRLGVFLGKESRIDGPEEFPKVPHGFKMIPPVSRDPNLPDRLPRSELPCSGAHTGLADRKLLGDFVQRQWPWREVKEPVNLAHGSGQSHDLTDAPRHLDEFEPGASERRNHDGIGGQSWEGGCRFRPQGGCSGQ